jgi:hypothetical protein
MRLIVVFMSAAAALARLRVTSSKRTYANASRALRLEWGSQHP